MDCKSILIKAASDRFAKVQAEFITELQLIASLKNPTEPLPTDTQCYIYDKSTQSLKAAIIDIGGTLNCTVFTEFPERSHGWTVESAKEAQRKSALLGWEGRAPWCPDSRTVPTEHVFV